MKQDIASLKASLDDLRSIMTELTLIQKDIIHLQQH